MPLWRRKLIRGAVALTSMAALALATVHVVQLLQIFGSRFSYPFDIEWMEGGQLYTGWRVLHGLPIYGDCSDGFIPFAYPPMHPWVLAAAGAVFGLDYPVARLVSIVAFATLAWLLAREAFMAGGRGSMRWVLAGVSLGITAATFPYAGTWYDVIRVDSLYVALLMLGAVSSLPPTVRGRRSPRAPLSNQRVLSCALLLTAASLTKQSALLFLPFICLFAVWRHPRTGAKLTLATTTLVLGALGWLSWSTDGRFFTIVFGVMSQHPLILRQLLVNAVVTVVHAPYLPFIPLLGLVLWRRRQLRMRSGFWLGMLINAAAVSLITSAKVGAFANNLMTLAVLLGPVAVVVCGDWLQAMPRRRLRRGLATTMLALLAAITLDRTRYPAEPHVPTATEWRQARNLNRYVASLEDVVFPSHSFIPIRNGITTRQIHEQGYIDVMGAGIAQIDVLECFAGVRGQWLVLDDGSQPHFVALIQLAYRNQGPIPHRAKVFTGQHTRPTRLLKLDRAAATHTPRARVRRLFDFEQSDFAGWKRAGTAFEQGPSVVINGYQSPIGGQRGSQLATSFHPHRGDAAVGELVSPSFMIDRTHMSLRIGGGRSPRLGVQLEIDDDVVRAERGAGTDFEMLGPVVWDVSELRGKRARLRLVDREPRGWGHILVDAVDLFDLPAR